MSAVDDPPDKNDGKDPSNTSLMTARPPPGAGGADVYSASTIASAASTDLLDLVRDAEEAAKVGTLGKTPTPSSASKFHAARVAVAGPAGERKDQYVDVDDDAIDAPPSLPPMRTAPPMMAAPPPHARVAARSSRPPPPVFEPIEPLIIPPLRPVALDKEDEEAPRSEARVRTSSSSSKKAVLPARSPELTATRGLPPIVSIVLLFALAIGALALMTR